MRLQKTTRTHSRNIRNVATLVYINNSRRRCRELICGAMHVGAVNREYTYIDMHDCNAGEMRKDSACYDERQASRDSIASIGMAMYHTNKCESSMSGETIHVSPTRMRNMVLDESEIMALWMYHMARKYFRRGQPNQNRCRGEVYQVFDTAHKYM